MRIVDHVYADTLYKIISDIIAQIDDVENYFNDKRNEDGDYMEDIQEEIQMKVKLVTPAIINLYHAFHIFVDDKVKGFVEKYKIEIPEEN